MYYNLTNSIIRNVVCFQFFTTININVLKFSVHKSLHIYDCFLRVPGLKGIHLFKVFDLLPNCSEQLY